MRRKLLFALIITFFFTLSIFIGAEMWLRSQHRSWDPRGAASGPRSHTHWYQRSVTTGYEAIPNQCK